MIPRWKDVVRLGKGISENTRHPQHGSCLQMTPNLVMTENGTFAGFVSLLEIGVEVPPSCPMPRRHLSEASSPRFQLPRLPPLPRSLTLQPLNPCITFSFSFRLTSASAGLLPFYLSLCLRLPSRGQPHSGLLSKAFGPSSNS